MINTLQSSKFEWRRSSTSKCKRRRSSGWVHHKQYACNAHLRSVLQRVFADPFLIDAASFRQTEYCNLVQVSYKFCTTAVLGSDLAYPCTYLFLYILVEPLHKLFTGSCTSFAQPLHCGKSCTRRKTGKNIFGLPCSSALLLVVTSNVLSAGELLNDCFFF